MKVGLSTTLHSPAAIELAVQAERLGVDSVWVPEFWAGDALTPLAFLAARTSTIRLATGIVQLGARTPATLAMSGQSLQALSGGRFVLGIGASGPQVMEGWHGVRFDRPVRRTRETIEIIRTIVPGAQGSPTEGSTRSGFVLNTGASHVSKILRRLEDDGLVQRTADPIDRRATLVSLTPSGETTALSVYALGDRMISEVLEGWSAADVRKYTALTKRFVGDAISAADRMLARGLLPIRD